MDHGQEQIDRGPAKVGVETGGGVAFSTTEELSARVHELAANASLRRTFGERGRRAFLDKWACEAHLSRYIALISELRPTLSGTS